MRQLYRRGQQGPRGKNEPSNLHKYIIMTESVNKQLNHRRSSVEKKNSVQIMHVTVAAFTWTLIFH